VYSSIVVAYDESPGAEAALQRAEEIAKAFGGSLNLVRSVTDSALTEAAHPETIAKATRHLQHEIDRFEPELSGDLWVVGGPPATAILAAAEEVDAELIVAGSRHRGAIARTLLGSVSSDLVHNAKCDVLIVPPADD
jgi:nucleotide-binding universal stress UspA family protein